MKRSAACAILLGALLCACAGASAPTLSPATPTPPLNFASSPFPNEMECVMVSAAPTGDPTELPLYPPPDDQDWMLGPADAEVTFLEYTDLQASASPVLDLNLARLAKEYPANVRRVFRHFPLPNHDKAMLAGAAAEAAGQQERFWEMTSLLMDRQAEWSGLAPADFRSWLHAQARSLGLDEARFAAGLDDPGIQQKLAQSQHFGLQSAIPVMPWLLINGHIYQGPRDYRSLENLVRLLMLEKKQYTTCPPFVIDPQKQYFARLQTAKGEIVVQLFPQKAPLAVNNFVFLSRERWYDGMAFHTVIPGYVAQAGDPSDSGLGAPGYAFRDDVNDLRFEQPGMLAMASPGPNSNGSQFFFTFRAAQELNGRYVIFGEILEGLDVLNRLTPRDPSSPEELADGTVIESVTIFD